MFNSFIVYSIIPGLRPTFFRLKEQISCEEMLHYAKKVGIIAPVVEPDFLNEHAKQQYLTKLQAKGERE